MNDQTQLDSVQAVAWLPPHLSIIVPTFNERDNIALLYEKLAGVFGATPFEMIVVDDITLSHSSMSR